MLILEEEPPMMCTIDDYFGSEFDDFIVSPGGNSRSGQKLLGDYVTIYPLPEPHYIYPPALLQQFSQKAIQKYNLDNPGSRYEFVELEEAFMHTSFEADCILVYFKACQRDAPNIITSFRADVESFSDSHLDIEVAPWHSDESGSDMSSASESESESEVKASPRNQGFNFG